MATPTGPDRGLDAAAFTALRPLLFAVAYRMLSSAADADDMVQEAWLRASQTAGEIREPRAWLLRTVTRLCLDEMRSARVRRERYVGPWLPEPVLTGEGVVEDPLALVERRELLSLGALAMLERLSPVERAVLVLREAMGLSHLEVARAVGVSEANSRQLLVRARRRLAGAPARVTPPPGAHRRLVEALRAAFDSGDAGPLVALLREDLVLVTDGGGEVLAARRPILGRDRALRFFVGVRDKQTPDVRARVAEVNGEPALVLQVEGMVTGVVTVVADEQGRAAEVLLVVAPGKLVRVRRGADVRKTGSGELDGPLRR